MTLRGGLKSTCKLTVARYDLLLHLLASCGGIGLLHLKETLQLGLFILEHALLGADPCVQIKDSLLVAR